MAAELNALCAIRCHLPELQEPVVACAHGHPVMPDADTADDVVVTAELDKLIRVALSGRVSAALRARAESVLPAIDHAVSAASDHGRIGRYSHRHDAPVNGLRPGDRIAGLHG